MITKMKEKNLEKKLLMKWVNYDFYIGIEENNSLKFIVSKKKYKRNSIV